MLRKTNSLQKNKTLIFFVCLFIIFLLGFLARYYIIGYGIGSGGNLYYSELVSMVLDNDLDLRNQFENLPFYDKLQTEESGLFYQRIVHSSMCYDKIINPQTSLGPAYLWSPFFAVAHLSVLILNLFGLELPANGFSHIEQMFTMFGSILYATIGLFIIYKFVTKIYEKNLTLFSIFAIVFGFSTIQYIAVEPSIYHAVTIFSVSLFLYYFYHTRNDNSYKKWIILGILSGIMLQTRWQEGFFFLIPLMYFIRDLFTTKELGKKSILLAKGLIYILIIFIIFLPQLFVFKEYNGGYFTLPEDAQNIMDFTDPFTRIPYFLFSFHHSLFVSTPIILISMIGAFFFYKKDKFFTISVLTTFALFVYINSSLVELGGNSFGYRRFIDFILIFVLFLTALLTKLKEVQNKKLYYGMISLIVILVIFNLIYFLEYNLNLIHRYNPVPYSLILEKSLDIIPTLLKYLS